MEYNINIKVYFKKLEDKHIIAKEFNKYFVEKVTNIVDERNSKKQIRIIPVRNV